MVPPVDGGHEAKGPPRDLAFHRRWRSTPDPERLPTVPDPRDLELRQTAFEHVRALSRRYDDIIPVDELRKGFAFRGERVSLGSFYSGIFRPR
jgi:hypothetical protein